MVQFVVFSACIRKGMVLSTLTIVAALLGNLSPLAGQTDTATTTLRNISLTEAVVQSTRADAKNPVPHTNYSAEKLARFYHAQDIPYLLSAVPSLVETSDGGTGTGYSGLRIRGSDPTRINVTINGVPLNDAESQAVYWVNLPDLVSSASEIQVQRGVGTSTNGAGAFGASVNLDLSKIEAQRFAIVTNSLGAFGTRKHALQVGTGLLDGKLAFTARVSGIYSDGYVDRARVNLDAIHLSGAYVDERQTVQFHLLSGHEITYQAWNGLPAQYLKFDSLRTYNTAGTERPGSPYPNEVDNYTQRHYLAHYKRTLSSKLMLQLNGHYTKGFGYYEQYKADQNIYEYGLPIGFFIDTILPPMDLIRKLWLNNDFYGSTFALRYLPGGIWKPNVLLGGAWSRYQGLHYGEVIWSEMFTGAANDYRYYENTADKQDANVFLKVETSPSKGLTTFLDLQWRGVAYTFLGFNQDLNQVEQQTQLGFFNPKIGANYAWSSHSSIYGFAGIGHREPNRDDYTQSTPNSRPRAEQMIDLETGWRQVHDNWSASANFFWMQYKDQLVLDGRINQVGAYIRTNVPDSWRTGLELEGSGQLGDFLALAGSASYSQNKIREFVEYRDDWDTGGQAQVVHRHTDLAFSPNFIARGEASFILNGQNAVQKSVSAKSATMSFTLVGKYVSRQFLDNTSNAQTELPSYFVSDLRLNFDLNNIFGKQASFMVSLNNWLGEKYASNGWAYRYISNGYDVRRDNAYTRLEGNGVYHQAGFFPQAGRNWMATLRLRF